MMLGVGRLPPPLLLKKPTITFSLLSQHQPQKPNLPLSTFSSLSFSGRSGFCLYARKKDKNRTFNGIQMKEKEKEKEGLVVEDDGFYFDEDDIVFDDDDDDDDDEFNDDVDDDDDEDEDEELSVVPKMNERKPRGFGEGKVYDTSIEDKLIEEIEQSLKAQIANIDKLKKEPIKPKPKSEPQEELFKGVPGGIRVRVSNLPKKRNIHRDLKSAFEGVTGIINISPVNSGNKKTRDPVCKGLAYVDFKSLKDADRFVQMFSGQNIAFGKAEKPIKCEILKPLEASNEESSFDEYNLSSEGGFTISEGEVDEDDDVEQTDPQLQLREDDDYHEMEGGLDGKYALGNVEKLSESERIKRIEMLELKLLARAALYEEEIKELKQKLEVKDKPDKKANRKTEKKANIKAGKKPKGPKLSLPGSAKKLKVQEKAKFADAFSRYGTRQTSGSKGK